MRVQLAARQHRLEHVGRVHRAFGGAGADDGVQLVDEQDDLALRDRRPPSARPSAAPRTRRDTSRRRPARPCRARRCACSSALRARRRDDALRQPFDDGGLADAGLADQDRIVLGAARQHLDDAADLLVAADDRIELALARELGEVAAVALERLVCALRVLARSRAGSRGPPSAPGGWRPCVTPRCWSRRAGRRRRPPSAAIARSRCSVLTYSSFSRSASSSAAS